jgi:hypothetical protein
MFGVYVDGTGAHKEMDLDRGVVWKRDDCERAGKSRNVLLLRLQLEKARDDVNAAPDAELK